VGGRRPLGVAGVEQVGFEQYRFSAYFGEVRGDEGGRYRGIDPRLFIVGAVLKRHGVIGDFKVQKYAPR